MRIVVIVLSLILISSVAFAVEDGVTAKILAYDIDDNGNIRVKTQYKIDGVEVKSNYPKLNDKYYFVTRYYALNFPGMTDKQIKDRILEDLNAHAENLVLDTFVKKNNQDIHDNHLSALVGSVISKIKATFKFDSDGDNIDDKEWTVYTNATYTEKNILISP